MYVKYSYRFVVQPERHPGHHDDEKRRDVDGDDVVRDLTLEGHVNSQTGIPACKKKIQRLRE